MKKFFNTCIPEIMMAMIVLVVMVMALQVPAQAGECIACHTASASPPSASLDAPSVDFNSMYDRTDIAGMPTTAKQFVGAVVPVASKKSMYPVLENVPVGKTTGENRMQVNKLYVSAVAFLPLPEH